MTNLHMALNQTCGMVSFHGPMISSNMINGLTDEETASFFDTINAESDFDYQNPKGFDIKTLKGGKATGNLVGGNLSLLSASIGTPFKEDPSYDENQIVLAALKDLDIPVVYNVQSGHGKPMMTLPMGALCTLDADEKRISFKVER